MSSVLLLLHGNLNITAGVLSTIVTIFLYLRSRFCSKSVASLPPGPRKLPIIGNALDMPTKFPAKTFAEMGKNIVCLIFISIPHRTNIHVDSDILHLNAFGTDIIVLNSYDMAHELLDKRSAIYSSRPKSVMLNELGGYNYLFASQPNNAEWRTHRRMFVKYFHPDKTEVNRPRETDHVHILLGKLLESPEHFMSHIRHMVGATSISMVYGLKTKSEDDPYINISEKALENLNEMITPGAFLVETFPLLKMIPEWFPGAHFHQFAKRSREVSEQVLDVTFKGALSAINDGNSLPSFIYDGMADMQNKSDIDQTEHVKALKGIGVTTYLASMDTTFASLTTFVLMMILHPEVQKTAQQELDEVLGERLPVHADITSMPYMNALYREILRWETPLSAGFAHLNTEEDMFEGYYIPNGSIVIPNQRAMLRDERIYPDAETFKPERFLKDGKLDETMRNPENIAFGFGRRICPGRHLAKSSLMLTMASVLSTFDIGKPVDKSGNVVEPSYEFNTLGVLHPKPFACSIKPRSKKAIFLIQSVAGG